METDQNTTSNIEEDDEEEAGAKSPIPDQQPILKQSTKGKNSKLCQETATTVGPRESTN